MITQERGKVSKMRVTTAVVVPKDLQSTAVKKTDETLLCRQAAVMNWACDDKHCPPTNCKLYLSKSIFFLSKMEKCFFQNGKMYLSKLPNIFARSQQ